MKITQIATILNAAAKESLGYTDTVLEDLSNAIDVGQLLTENNTDAYVKSLINHIGRVIFDDRTYNSQVPSLLMDGWEYGSILEKIRASIPDSVDNPAWNLQKGQSYDPHTFYDPLEVKAKFFNSRDTKMIPMSFAKKQVKQSFSSAAQLNAFFSMLENRIRVRETIDMDNLKRMTMNNFIAAALYNAFPDGKYGAGSKKQAINLLYEYNIGKTVAAKLTKANCMSNIDFLKFAAKRMALVSDYMTEATVLYNIGETVKFTPKNLQKIVLLSEFAKSADVYLQSDTFHNDFVKFPKADEISFWQGTGNDHSFKNNSTINIKGRNPSAPTDATQSITVNAEGILGFIADHDAMGVCNEEQYVTAEYNPLAEFTNQWYKYEAQYFNDYDEQFVVFYVADEADTFVPATQSASK